MGQAGLESQQGAEGQSRPRPDGPVQPGDESNPPPERSIPPGRTGVNSPRLVPWPAISGATTPYPRALSSCPTNLGLDGEPVKPCSSNTVRGFPHQVLVPRGTEGTLRMRWQRKGLGSVGISA